MMGVFLIQKIFFALMSENILFLKYFWYRKYAIGQVSAAKYFAAQTCHFVAQIFQINIT